jgi:hypothetical protein
MKKNNLIRMLIFGMIFMLFGCSEDLFDEPVREITNRYKIRKTTFNKIKDVKMKSLVLKSQKTLISQRAYKSTSRELENYIVDTTNVIEISDGSFSFFTFPIISTDSTKLENLVSLNYNDEEYKSYIVEYDLSSQEIEALNSNDETIEITPDYITDLETNSRMSPEGPCVIISYESVFACNDANGNTIITEGNLGDGCVGLPFDLVFEVMNINTSCNSLFFGSGGLSNTGTIAISNGGSGGGGGSGGNYSSITSSDPSVLTTPVLPVKNFDMTKTPCVLIKKLKKDFVFKTKLAVFFQSAKTDNFERYSVISTDPTPNLQPGQEDSFDYADSQGLPNGQGATYTAYSNSKGVIHTHYVGLNSIFSPDDLQDLYNKMIVPEITDDFFIGVVTAEGTAYILQVTDRLSFIEFRNKYLADKKKIEKFTSKYYEAKYNLTSNNLANNEKNFLKMMSDMGSGLSLAGTSFLPSTQPTYSLFDNLQQKTYNELTTTVQSTNCN